MLDDNLKSKIKDLWNSFWNGGISNPLTAIEQISYLIFIKRLEDEDNKKKENSKFKDEKFISIFEGVLELMDGRKIDKKKCRWNYIQNLQEQQTKTDYGMLDHMKVFVFPFIQNLSIGNSNYSKHLKDSNLEIPTFSLLQKAVNLINSMDIKEQNSDTKGDIYEYLLKELKTAGKNGQFRTPRHIIKLIVNLINPQKNDKILDPSCGTSGFLLNAYQNILKLETSKEFIKIDKEGLEYNFIGDKLKPIERKKIDENIFGYEIDSTMTRLSLMNLMMHGIENPKIEKLNTLTKNFSPLEKFDVILANPPFKGSIDETELSSNFTIKTKKTELLFLELIYDLLENNGGRCGVIVPEGVLFSQSKAHKEIRKKLLENCRLDLIISMPSGVFKPYAGVSTSILIFTKGEPTKKVHFFEMKNDGFTLDDKRVKIDGKGDIPNIIKSFNEIKTIDFSDRTKQFFYVGIEKIIKEDYNLNLSTYKEEIIIEKNYRDIKIIKNELIQIEENILNSLNQNI